MSVPESSVIGLDRGAQPKIVDMRSTTGSQIDQVSSAHSTGSGSNQDNASVHTSIRETNNTSVVETSKTGTMSMFVSATKLRSCEEILKNKVIYTKDAR